MTTAKKNSKLYDNGVLIRLRATQKGWTAASAEGKDAVVSQTGARLDAFTVSKKLVPSEYTRAVKAPVDRARRAIRESGVQWSTNDGGRKEDGWWLVPLGRLQDLETVLRECRVDREDAVRQFLASYHDIVAQRRVDLGSMFKDSDYPSKEAVAATFTWNVDIQPIWSMSDVENDLRVKLPKSWAQEQIEAARVDEKQRIANAVAEAAHEVRKFVDETVGKLTSHDTTTEDKREGQSFKEKPLRKNVGRLRERMASLNEVLDDPALDDVVTSLADLESKMDAIPKGVLQADSDGSVRSKVADDLSKVGEVAGPATDRLSALLGDG